MFSVRHLFTTKCISPRQSVVGMALFLMFMQLPDSKAGFTEIPSPMLVVVTVGKQHTYKCSHSTASTISWRVNDGVLGVEISTIPGIEYTDTISHPDDSIFTLQVRALSRNNETTIQCTAGGQTLQRSHIATFLIQGELQSVINLVRNGSTFAWEAPFSLDLTDIDPDIVYCVDVVNITCGRRDLIVSDCNVTELSYTSDDIAPHGYIYEYTVTPRSNVEGAKNGTSVTVSEKFVLMKSSRQPQLSMINESDVMVSIHMDIYNIQALAENQVYAESHTISLTALDGQNDGDEMKHLPNNKVFRNASSVMFQVPLPFRRLWNYTLLAHGCDEHPLMNATLLSTHDVQEIFIASPSAGTIMISGNFFPDSPAVGVLVAVSNTSEISFHLLRREGNMLHNKGVLSNVRGGQHVVSVFVVDQTGLPFIRAATIPQRVVINGNNNLSFPIQYELTSTSTGVCITCTFLDNSTTDCVAVVHQQISQLSSSGLMKIESSHKFDRSGDTAYGCIERVNLDQYEVGLVGGTTKQLPTLHTTMSKSTACATSCVVGVAIPTILLITASFAILFYVGIFRKRRRNRLPTSTAIADDLPASGMTHYNMYETVELRTCSDNGGDTQVDDATAVSGAQETHPDTATPTVSGDADNDPTPKPVTLEHLLPELLPLASKWQSLGEALSLNDDRLDEIFTNNETDEACLEVMLEVYMARPDLDHSWEEVRKALKKIEEESTAGQPKVPPREKAEVPLREKAVLIRPELASREQVIAVSDEDLSAEVSQNEEPHSLTCQNEKEDPPDNTTHHDPPQQESNWSNDQPEHNMDNDNYPSDFDQQAGEPSEITNRDCGQFESGRDTAHPSVTGSLTDDNRSLYDVNKSEEYQSNICSPLPFNTECEEQFTNHKFGMIEKETCTWSESASSLNGTDEFVVSSNWHFLEQGNIDPGAMMSSFKE